MIVAGIIVQQGDTGPIVDGIDNENVKDAGT